MAEESSIKIPMEIYNEIAVSQPEYRDELENWVRNNRDILVLAEEPNQALLNHVMEDGYANDLTDEEIARIGADPFLVGYAMRDPSERTIITTEVSKPTKTRANRRVPDVCRQFGIGCENLFYLNEVLDFRTDRGRR